MIFGFIVCHKESREITNMKEVWVIYEEDGLNPNYKTFRIYDDEAIALESYMSLVEEDLYIGFYLMTQDELEFRPVEEIAKDIKINDTIYRVTKGQTYSITQNEFYRKVKD